MPAYKSERTLKNGKKKVTWYVKFRCNGKQVLKRGFQTKKKANEFERDYISKNEGNPDMLFKDYIELFYKDKEDAWKESSRLSYTRKIQTHIVPFFGDMRLNEITYKDVRKWHQELIEKGLKDTYRNRLNKLLSTVFNHAVKYYELKENPCRKAGSTGSTKRQEIKFWTLDEFKEFIAHVDKLPYKVAFDTLYYTGMRVGELKALTLNDINFSVPSIKICKTCSPTGHELTPPKTESSIREVTIPRKLADEILELTSHYYGFSNDDLLFPYATYTYSNNLKKICEEFNLKAIRVHDLRHSHASLLINNGEPVTMVSERLGHASIKQTLDTYAHLFPSRQIELIDKLDELI